MTKPHTITEKTTKNDSTAEWEKKIAGALTRQREEILKGVILPEGITQDEVNRVVNYFTTIGIIDDLIEQAEHDTARQCYLECLAVECDEGECARAIRTKFNLKV